MSRISNRVLLFAGLFFMAQSAFGATLNAPSVDYPNLVQHAQTSEEFVPVGWRLEVNTSGDLNGDNLPDVVLVLRETSSVNVVNASAEGGSKQFNTNPRILAVALADPRGGYRLVTENHTLIPRTIETSADDYLDTDDGAVVVKRGVLQVHLRLFMSSGGWDTVSKEFTFRSQDGNLELIGYDSSDVMRNSGETKDVSINYLTARMKITTGNISSEGADQVFWKRLPKRTLLTIGQIGNGLTFDPESK